MADLDPTTLWNRVLEALSGKIAARTVDTLLRPLEPMDATTDALGGVFLLAAPNEFSRDWASRHYGPLIEEQLRAITGTAFSLHWTLPPAPPSSAPANNTPSSRPAPPAPARKAAAPAARKPAAARSAAVPAPSVARDEAPGRLPTPSGIARGLHPKYTFEHFVAGPSNQLAHAAALAMGQPTGRRFNPLFLYGQPGLGKTHLINAVGHRILEHKPDACVIYVSAEHFTNEFVGALQSRTMDEFRARYRNTCDALLLDDVQFLSGRDQTLEEFFHTFNALFLQDKPIILTSDVAPSELKGMTDRLVSRFSSGLAADINPPELDTRVAILRKKAALEGIALDDEAALALAHAVASNVRDLEGMLMKLAIKASLGGRPGVDATLVREALRLPTRTSVTTVEDVQRAVCDHFRVKQSEMNGPSRHQGIALPRQLAMYLCRERLGTSFPQIGAKFGGKDHTTVIAAVNKIKKLLAEGHAVQRDLDAINARLAAARGTPG